MINTNSWAAVKYEGAQLRCLDMRGYDRLSWHIPENEAQLILDTVGARSNYQRIDSARTININSWTAIKYENEQLRLMDTKGYEHISWSVPADEAQIIISKIRKAGQANALKADFSAHSKTLNKALSSRDTYEFTSKPDSNVAILLIAAFMMVSTDSHAADHTPDLESGFESRGGGDFTGGGASDDFGQDQEQSVEPDNTDTSESEVEVDADTGADAADTDTGGYDGGSDGGGGGCECTSNPQADPIFARTMGKTRGNTRFESFSPDF